MNHRQQLVIDYLREENRVLREQLGGRRVRLDDKSAPQIGRQGQGTGPEGLGRDRHHCQTRDPVGLASETGRPEVRRNGLSCTGRPRTSGEIEALVVCIAEESRDWGYRRIEGALSSLVHDLARSTIAQILKRHGMEPAPERSRKTTRDYIPGRRVRNFTRSGRRRRSLSFACRSRIASPGRQSESELDAELHAPAIAAGDVLSETRVHLLTGSVEARHRVDAGSGTGCTAELGVVERIVSLEPEL
jgi:hypothetical protein